MKQVMQGAVVATIALWQNLITLPVVESQASGEDEWCELGPYLDDYEGYYYKPLELPCPPVGPAIRIGFAYQKNGGYRTAHELWWVPDSERRNAILVRGYSEECQVFDNGIPPDYEKALKYGDGFFGEDSYGPLIDPDSAVC